MSCTGCEYHTLCAAAVLGAMGSPDIWRVQSGTEERPECETWKKRHAAEKEPKCVYTGHTEPFRDCGDCPHLEGCELQQQEAESDD
jgi:hypothetical protein